MFVDSDHVGENCSLRFHTGLPVYLNNALISWYSKKQNTFEMYTFNTEFVAMETGVEIQQEIWHKLYIIGKPMDFALCIYRDSMSVMSNTSQSESVLQKKNNTM
ncbi:hypothetical protein ACHAXS_000598 [Conticribra weissflogii]